MAELVLGPILRHVDADAATVWVETDAPCEVTILGTPSRPSRSRATTSRSSRSKGLDPGESTAYEVELDGETRLARARRSLPARPASSRSPRARASRFIFGSCRVSYPHEEPWVLHHTKHPEGQGIDALRALALRG